MFEITEEINLKEGFNILFNLTCPFCKSKMYNIDIINKSDQLIESFRICDKCEETIKMYLSYETKERFEECVNLLETYMIKLNAINFIWK
jgi:hypothetical protein